jgi:DNA-binding transcriptional ArsR family regulator
MSRRRDRTDRALEDAAPVFVALGDPTRLAVVARLCKEGPQSITRLSQGAAVSRQAITKHLETLAEAGLVRDTRRGRERVWEMEPRRLDLVRRELARLASQWDAALGRLQLLVEED